MAAHKGGAEMTANPQGCRINGQDANDHRRTLQVKPGLNGHRPELSSNDANTLVFKDSRRI
jgi:hypothetical protein